MGKYRIKIFPMAENDLLEIVEYLNTLLPQAALKYYNLIIESVGSLADLPERCPLVKDAQLRLRGYRALLIKNYIVFYLVNGNTVEIRRILYAKRQYETLL
jgi:toxin ParE1/3/4